MTLSPEQVAQFRQQAGLSATPPPAPAPGAGDVLAQRKATLATTQSDQPTEDSGEGVGGFLKGLVSAPATMIARPIQAVAELAGADPDKVDAVTKKLTDGIVAPVPRNFSDVEKDVGRGVETVALGAGATAPVAAGAALGLGNSLEQGNDLFSVKTALNTALGAAGGKVLDLLGKPIFNAAGKVVGAVTPEFLQDLAAKGTTAIQDFAKAHEILPEPVRNAIETGVDKAETLANKPFDYVKNTATNLKDVAVEGANTVVDKTKAVLGKGPETEGDIFNDHLTDAYQSVYGKLTPTEKASIQLKDVGDGFSKKSVPDFVNDPNTRPVVESVANLPDDIKLKPDDTLATREDKLNQGISRLHQGTDGMLSDPKIKAQTSFNDARYNKYMKSNVLDPVAREFGEDSVEYRATEKAIQSAKSSLPSNDASGVYRGRQKFNAQWESENPRMFKKAKGSFGAQLDPQTSATVDAGRDVYNALNDFNEELLPENHPLRPRMREESNLIRAKQEMRARSSGEIGKSSLTRTLDKHPLVKGAIKKATNAVGLGGAIDMAEHIF